jgi:RNA polymerase sigma-70 factor (ECF subfamily)
VQRQCIILRNVDAASSKPADLDLPISIEQRSTAPEGASIADPALPQSLVDELWRAADAGTCGLDVEEFCGVLAAVGEKVNHGLPPGGIPDSSQRAAFLRSLHLVELALSHGCALGRDAAWAIFLSRYRAFLVQAAKSITGSATLGQDLADSLYAELYGLRCVEGERRSPLASYSGRGSLQGWLRTTLVQRFRDHHRSTHRETPLDEVDIPAPSSAAPQNLAQLAAGVARTLRSVDAEDRFLLSAYYLDRQTLLQIAQTLGVHEATISRRLKRLSEHLRRQLVENLISAGLSKAAAQEALGADPRDIEINLRSLLQTSQTQTFSKQAASNAATGQA